MRTSSCHLPFERGWSRRLLLVLSLTTAVICLPANGVASALQEPATAAQEPATPDAPAQEGKAADKADRPPLYDEAADAAAQIDAALAKAKRENRRVLIQWGANWCGWCHLLHNCFSTDGEVARKLQYEYDLVLVDVGRADRNLELAEKYQADFAKQGLPFLTVLDGDGKVVANQETESLESKEEGVKAHDPAAVLEFLTKHQSTAMSADEVLAEGTAAAKQSGRLVFLHFGAPWCGWCHRLEDWMQRSENSSILEKYFVDIKIDTDRMTGGAELLQKFRGDADGGIPWFVFVDPESGKAVATSDGPKGNLGFPWTDEEIAGFGRMLESLGERCTADDRQKLLDSLTENRKQTEARANAARSR